MIVRNNAVARFADRAEAGRELASRLAPYSGRADTVVLGLPRGGVIVAAEVALGLRAPLDVFVVRKLGVPGQPELAMGAIASGGVRVVSEDVVHALRVPASTVDAVAAREFVELERRDHAYRQGRPLQTLQSRTVVLVDDGLATGATMRAAVEAVRLHQPSRIVVAVPVGPLETCQHLRRCADEVVCSRMPEPFEAVGAWYERFDQNTDEDVVAALDRVRSAFRSIS